MALGSQTHCLNRDFCTGTPIGAMLPTRHGSHVYQSLLLVPSYGDPKIIKTQSLLFRNPSSYGGSTDKQKSLSNIRCRGAEEGMTNLTVREVSWDGFQAWVAG